MQPRPKATVAVIVENEKGEILLEKRKIEPFKGFWCLPGGHIELNETSIGAAKKEVKEETGIEIEPKFLFYQDEIIPEKNWHAVALVFHSKVKRPKLIPQEKEVEELRWFGMEDALKLKLAFRAKEVLEKFSLSKAKSRP